MRIYYRAEYDQLAIGWLDKNFGWLMDIGMRRGFLVADRSEWTLVGML